MDADSGAILYGKNIHEAYYPASITKLLTALVVIENSPDLNEIVTFSKNAVYNVEEGSSNAGLSPGDQLSIRDCLYALLLKSANESANALAEHICGTIPHFVELMNAKAEQLGCTNSHFANPSGLNDPNHYTSAYDMALIAKAAFSNDTLTEIASTTYYDLPPLKQYPEGQTVYIGHKMLKKNFSSYYPYAIAGKTGYTSLAGNTLVTYAKKDGMRLVAVILKGENPYHYSDTKTLFEFGFQNFKTLPVTDYETRFTALEDDLSIAGLTSSRKPLLTLSTDSYITLPKGASFEEAESVLSYKLTLPYPSTAVAELDYSYQGQMVGRAYLELDPSMLSDEISAEEIPETLAPDQLPTLEAEENSLFVSESGTDTSSKETVFDGLEFLEEGTKDEPIPSTEETVPFQTPQLVRGVDTRKESSSSNSFETWIWPIAILLLILSMIGGLWYFWKMRRQKQRIRLEQWRQKRNERLLEAGYSTKEFDRLLREKQNKISSSKPPKNKHKKSSKKE